MIGELSVAIPLAIACVAISAFFSGTEVAVFSLRRVEREQLAGAPRLVDRRIHAMLGRPRRLIATVLIGSQASHAVLAMLAFIVAEHNGADAPLAFWLALAVTLPLIVLGAEITAKTIAAKAALRWSRLAALPLTGFAWLVAPARWVIQGASWLVLTPLGSAARQRPARDLSEAEFRKLVDAGSAQGQVDARERRLIHRVFEFNDKDVGQVMTPRERVFALAYDLPAQRMVKELAARGFSRVPIYQKSLDNIRGILNAKDLVRTTAGQPLGRPLNELLHEPLFVPRTTPVKRLFLTFKQKKVHMAIVVSEYGKLLGLVTMDDLLSQIFGVLRDERTALQASIPPGRQAVRAPVEVKPDADRSGPTAIPVGIPAGEAGESSSPVTPEPTGGVSVLDPPPRSVHPFDEVTPPAIDIAELRSEHASYADHVQRADQANRIDNDADAASHADRTERPGSAEDRGHAGWPSRLDRPDRDDTNDEPVPDATGTERTSRAGRS